MESFVSWLLTILSGLVAVPTTVLCLEISAGVLRRKVLESLPGRDNRGRIAVLVPAHNESTAMVPTLEDIKAQLCPGDHLLVLADNCSDDTAAVARAAGAEVVERHDPERIGKGYALDCGLRHLERVAPDIVVMVDADCRLAEGAIGRMASACMLTGRPVQALYLMTAPNGTKVSQQVSEFAWRVKNWVRPLGLAALGLPCQLMGAGLACPWDVIRSIDLASGSIVEDLKLGLDLTSAGHPPLFCPSALVTSEFAASVQGIQIQRQRWEQGHIGMILQSVPRLIWTALAQRSPGLFGLTLDLAVPPLSLLSIFVAAMLVIAGVAALLGLSSVALVVCIANLLAFFFAVVLAWLKFGRDVLPPRAILSIPGYILGKLGTYREVLFDRATTQWIRTDRTKS
jgi:cellulose synthase/poly-beta-1,6-N-acetylglucosamine synthase-like glycosyltransferase